MITLGICIALYIIVLEFVKNKKSYIIAILKILTPPVVIAVGIILHTTNAIEFLSTESIIIIIICLAYLLKVYEGIIHLKLLNKGYPIPKHQGWRQIPLKRINELPEIGKNEQQKGLIILYGEIKKIGLL